MESMAAAAIRSRRGWLESPSLDIGEAFVRMKMAMGQHQYQWYGAPPILVYFSGDWDVHWGYGVLTHSHIYIYMYTYIHVKRLNFCLVYLGNPNGRVEGGGGQLGFYGVTHRPQLAG